VKKLLSLNEKLFLGLFWFFCVLHRGKSRVWKIKSGSSSGRILY